MCVLYSRTRPKRFIRPTADGRCEFVGYYYYCDVWRARESRPRARFYNNYLYRI